MDVGNKVNKKFKQLAQILVELSDAVDDGEGVTWALKLCRFRMGRIIEFLCTNLFPDPESPHFDPVYGNFTRVLLDGLDYPVSAFQKAFVNQLQFHCQDSSHTHFKPVTWLLALQENDEKVGRDDSHDGCRSALVSRFFSHPPSHQSVQDFQTMAGKTILNFIFHQTSLTNVHWILAVLQSLVDGARALGKRLLETRVIAMLLVWAAWARKRGWGTWQEAGKNVALIVGKWLDLVHVPTGQRVASFADNVQFDLYALLVRLGCRDDVPSEAKLNKDCFNTRLGSLSVFGTLNCSFETSINTLRDPSSKFCASTLGRKRKKRKKRKRECDGKATRGKKQK